MEQQNQKPASLFLPGLWLAGFFVFGAVLFYCELKTRGFVAGHNPDLNETYYVIQTPYVQFLLILVSFPVFAIFYRLSHRFGLLFGVKGPVVQFCLLIVGAGIQIASSLLFLETGWTNAEDYIRKIQILSYLNITSFSLIGGSYLLFAFLVGRAVEKRSMVYRS